jgi:hypothetical protein
MGSIPQSHAEEDRHVWREHETAMAGKVRFSVRSQKQPLWRVTSEGFSGLRVAFQNHRIQIVPVLRCEQCLTPHVPADERGRSQDSMVPQVIEKARPLQLANTFNSTCIALARSPACATSFERLPGKAKYVSDAATRVASIHQEQIATSGPRR